jgi:hypothetical protein
MKRAQSAPSSEVLEVKRFPGGSQETFRCLTLDVSPRLAVLLFPHPSERRAGGFLFPAGSRTYGFFWARRHYLLYVLHGPDGGLIAHRFDVVDEVRLRPGRVEYLDLALDIWVDPSGRAWAEDEDEVFELGLPGASLARSTGPRRAHEAPAPEAPPSHRSGSASRAAPSGSDTR